MARVTQEHADPEIARGPPGGVATAAHLNARLAALPGLSHEELRLEWRRLRRRAPSDERDPARGAEPGYACANPSYRLHSLPLRLT